MLAPAALPVGGKRGCACSMLYGRGDTMADRAFTGTKASPSTTASFIKRTWLGEDTHANGIVLIEGSLARME